MGKKKLKDYKHHCCDYSMQDISTELNAENLFNILWWGKAFLSRWNSSWVKGWEEISQTISLWQDTSKPMDV